MSENGKTPSYEDMLHAGYGEWSRFVLSLEPGEPKRIEMKSHLTDKAKRSGLYMAARRLGIPVMTREIDGERWVVRLKPEDVKERS